MSELIAGSDACALVTVSNSTVRENPSGDVKFFIHYAVKVDDLFYGNLPKEFEIRVPAVSSDGGAAPLPGSPGFTSGSSWVVFLKDLEEKGATCNLVSLGQGAVRVAPHPTGEEGPVAVVRFDPRGETGPGIVLVELSNLKAQIGAVRSNLSSGEGDK